MDTKLSPTQEKVAMALAAGATVTSAAEEAGISRVTVYRWMSTVPEFAPAIERNRAEFTLARRDDLHYLASRAMEALLSILDNPRSSPAVLLKAAMFILQRDQKPAKNWSMHDRLPAPDSIPEAVVSQAVADDATECNTVPSENSGVASQPQQNKTTYTPGYMPSCPVPSLVLEDRKLHQELRNMGDQLRWTPKVSRAIDAYVANKGLNG